MKLDKPMKKNRGKPTGNVRVLITEVLYGIGPRGKSTSFGVYETTPDELKRFFIKKIKEDLK